LPQPPVFRLNRPKSRIFSVNSVLSIPNNYRVLNLHFRKLAIVSICPVAQPSTAMPPITR
jgi:hypothetical protein